jgi:hypothetical protein
VIFKDERLDPSSRAAEVEGMVGAEPKEDPGISGLPLVFWLVRPLLAERIAILPQEAV